MIIRYLNGLIPDVIKRIFIAMLFLSIFYRVCFFDVLVNTYHIALSRQLIFYCVASDVGFALSASFFLLILHATGLRFFVKKLNYFFLFIFFMLLAIIYFVNYQLIFDFFVNLNFRLVVTNYGQINLFKNGMDYVAYVNTISVILFLIAAIICQYIVQHFHSFLSPRIGCIIVSVLYAILVFTMLVFPMQPSIRSANALVAMCANPCSQLLQSFIKNKMDNHQKQAVMLTQIHSVKLLDPDFLNSVSGAPLPAHALLTPKWNVVFFVMDTVGLQYVKDPKYHPMPFLTALAKKSIWANNNYSAGNMTPLGQFGIFTGIYPPPSIYYNHLENNVTIPTIADWLGKSYDSFMVSPGDDAYFFTALNHSYAEYDNENVMEPGATSMFIDEKVGIHFFLRRLQKAKPPFLAVYWGVAAHYPYQFYPSDRLVVRHPQTNYECYLNALALLDQEIKQVYQALREKNVLDHTIIVVVGDHGENFQSAMPGHGLSLSQGEITAPLLIYAPALFHPKVIDYPTSSIDILPTILDALHIQYGTRLQGESLSNDKPLDKFVFVYGGNQDVLASINTLTQLKTSYSFDDASCVNYELRTDPAAKNPLHCNTDNLSAILKFRSLQPVIVTWYNQINKRSRV